jgi:hypothetical protein
MRKLTDEELSRVLTAAANGDLSYWSSRCCVGAHAVVTSVDGDIPPGQWERFWELSHTSSFFTGRDYPGDGDPDVALAFLESRGLA